MKKKQWIILAAVIVLAVVVAIVGILVRKQQLEKEKVGAITLKCGGQEYVIPISGLDREAFSGETVNGKGDRFTRYYRGVELSALLTEKKIDMNTVSAVKAESADQYTAELTGEEIRESGKVYLAVQVDGKTVEGIEPGKPGVQMIVFGDPNSKRAVRNLAIIEVKVEK
ncbi:MAG: hypothetical protein IKO00_00910 [Oscillospiraceae bacterium]|nr:hypothetical protein [Oscillospiraceae bacterium]